MTHLARIAVAFLCGAVLAHTLVAVPELRGFGRCEMRAVRAGAVTEMRFSSSSVAGAETVLGKFLYDLSAQEGVAFADGIWSIPGGNAYALVLRGVKASVFAADSRTALADYLKAHPEIVPVETAKCPEWMKLFAWGSYGVGGLENFHSWMQKAGAGKQDLLDPREDMDFLRAMGPMHFDAWLQLAGFDNSDGIAAPGAHWQIACARAKGVPYATRFYMPANGYAWSNRRFAAYNDEPAPWMMNGWLRYSEHQPHFSWYKTDIWNYLGRESQKLMAQFDDGSVRGWMHPAGELVHQPWYDMHADYSPEAKASWIRYLKAHGVTLEEAGEMYSRPRDAFVDWAQVEVPEFATFAGLPGLTLDLAGTWFTSTNETEWSSLEMPGNWEFLSLYGPAERSVAKAADAKRAFKRTFDYARAGEKTYLYFFPMNRNPNVRHHLTLNGAPFEVGEWCALDVTTVVRPFANDLRIDLTGPYWNGRIFLSSQPPAVYPNLGRARNRMFALWNDWRREEKAARCAAIFAAMRQVDPNAPIKFMAPIQFGTPITDRLMSDWGGYAHFTGEGVWYFPWYKRYGKLYGYQGTSELAGPYTTVAEANRSTLRVFLAGLDLHEPVFLTQSYSRSPALRDWWLRHKPLLGRLGKQDIYGPQVLIYRRSTATLDRFPAPYPRVGEATRRVNTPWDWDIGRGSLQSIGQSMLYIDDDGLADGKMYDYPLVFDGGNEVIPPERIADLETWVRNGGVYVALPFSGRSTATEGDSWPIARLAGAHVLRERPLGGKVAFSGKGVLKSFGTTEYEDSGKTVNSLGNNLNDASLELAADDAEVAATYENGAAAVTVRRLGKGLVVWFGSAFWRDAKDVDGIWWPGAGEREFLVKLLAAVGFAKPLCETDDPLVWTQPYRSNDGASFVTTLCNFNREGEQTPTLTLRLPAKPGRLVTYGADGVLTPDFSWKDGVATVTLPLAAQEVKVVSADVFGAADAVDYWWRENASAWHPLKEATGDFAKYDEGAWRDSTQDLKSGWTFEDGHPCVCDALQFWGLGDGAAAKIVKRFDIANADWFKGGETRLVTGAWVGQNFLTKGRVYLNDVELTKGPSAPRYAEWNVATLLRPTGNELVIAFEKPSGKFTGLVGSIYLYHRDPAARSYELAKTGSTRTVYIPKEWEGRYRVFLYMADAKKKPPLGVSANHRFMRKHHHNFGNVTDVDITSILKFGAENVLTLTSDFNMGRDNGRLATVRLDLYEVK